MLGQAYLADIYYTQISPTNNSERGIRDQLTRIIQIKNIIDRHQCIKKKMNLMSKNR